MARQGRPHSGAAHPRRALDRLCESGERSLQTGRHDLPARPERRVRRRLFPGDALQRLRAARVGGDGLSRCRDPQALQPHHLDRDAGEVADHGRHAMRRRLHLRLGRDGEEQEFRANEVILSSGAIHSPAHLLRAGIGPVGHLNEMGIPVVAALEGVGQRLMDHPSISLSSFIKRGNRMNEHTRRHIQLGIRYSSGLPGIPRGDMFTAVVNKSAWHSVGEQIASLLTFINRTYSETGQVKLASRDWRAEPEVEFNLCSDRRDVDRLKLGFRKMAALQMTPVVRTVADTPFPASYTDKVRKIGVVNTKNKILTAVIAQFLDGPQALRKYMIENLVVEGFTFDQVMNDDEALEEFVKKNTIGVWHASCTCRMGRAADPMAVTDTQGRVKGVQGLRVVDASVFPIVPCANTNFPTLMTAEKIAAAVMQ